MSSFANIKGARRMTKPTIPKSTAINNTNVINTDVINTNIDSSILSELNSKDSEIFEKNKENVSTITCSEIIKEISEDVLDTLEIKDDIKPIESDTKIQQSQSSSSSTKKSLDVVFNSSNKILNSMYSSINKTIEISGYSNEQYCNFNNLLLHDGILKAIYQILRWEAPSPIQSIGIKPVIEGRDLLCQSQAGTGKTAAYMIAAIQLIDQNLTKCQALVLAPTRELNQQIFVFASTLTTFVQVYIASHMGGDDYPKDGRNVRYYHNVKPNNKNHYPIDPYSEHIIIATPGRLLRLMTLNQIDCNNIKLVILDEADKLLNGGFLENIIDILKHIDKKVQIALYSATINYEIETLANKFMNKPVSILVSAESVVLTNQKQYLIKANSEKEKETIISNIFKIAAIGQVIIFTNSKVKVDQLVSYIKTLGITVCGIKAGDDINQSDRTRNLNLFRQGDVKILVATDIIARGIDTIVDLVINYDIPLNTKEYVHRIGRTGRFGKTGDVINIVFTKESIITIKDISKEYSINMLPLDQYIKSKKELI